MDSSLILAAHSIANLLITLIAIFYLYQGYKSWKRQKEAEERMQEEIGDKLRAAFSEIALRFAKHKTDQEPDDLPKPVEYGEFLREMRDAPELMPFSEWLEKRKEAPDGSI